MPDYKLDDDVPMPEADPSEPEEELIITADDPDDYIEEPEEPKVPGKRGRKKRCYTTDHVWRDIGVVEGHAREKCAVCCDVFPCINRAKCLHVDCWEALGLIHPWVASGVMIPKHHAWSGGKCIYCRLPSDYCQDPEGLGECPGEPA